MASWLAAGGLTAATALSEPPGPAMPAGVEARRGIVYGRSAEDRPLRLDIYRPAGAAPVGGWPVVLAIHGGGWRGGARQDIAAWTLPLVGHGIAVVAIDYTLSRPGRASWPSNRDDTRAAVRWVRRHATEQGLDPARIAALGASAGGHLAALLGTDPGTEEASVSAVVSLYGPADLATLGGACRMPGGPLELLFGRPVEELTSALLEAASPTRHASAGDAPALLIHGTQDRLVPPGQSEALAARLAAVGVAVRCHLLPAEHGFGLSVGGLDLVPEILEFLHVSWNDTDSTQARHASAPRGDVASPRPPAVRISHIILSDHRGRLP